MANTEQTPRYVEAMLNSLVELSPIGVGFSRDGVVISANQAYLKMFGYVEINEIRNLSLLNMIAPGSRSDVLERINKRIQQVIVESTYEAMGLRKNCTEFPILVSAKRIDTPDGPLTLAFLIDLTEQKRNEIKFKTIFDSSRDAVMLLDGCRFFDCNEQTLRIFGCGTTEDFCSKHPADLSPPQQPCGTDSMVLANSHIAVAMAQGSFQFDWIHRRADNGKDFAAEVLLSAFELDGKKVLQASVRDITERKKAEEKLQRSERNYRELLEQAGDAITVADHDGLRYLDVNQAACDLFGYTREEFLRLGLEDFIQPDEMIHSPIKLEDMWSGKVIHTDRRLRRKDGSFVPVELKAKMLSDGRLLSIKRDITERKKVEEELHKIHSCLAAAQSLACIGSWEWDVANDTAYWSDETYRIFGMAQKDMNEHREHFLDMISPQDRGLVNQALSNALNGVREYDIEYRICLADGTCKVIHALAEVVRNAEGKPLVMRGTVQDITERKHIEEALQREKDEQITLVRKLEEAQNHLLQVDKMASIGQLAAGVAHEINNPIGFVYSNLGSLERYLDDIGEILEMYERAEEAMPEAIRAEVRKAKEQKDLAYLREDMPALMKESRDGISRVKKIIQDLKEFSHAGESDDWQWVDLHRGLDSTLGIVWNEIKYHAEVQKEYGDIPEVECLPSQINQVFMNLLVNAAHAIETTGVITIRTGTKGEEVFVQIADTGKGIPPENMKRIFDPFFTTKPVGKGTGLGLSLSFGLMQKHNGRIEVQSEVGKGTTFTLWLPVIHQTQEVYVLEMEKAVNVADGKGKHG